MFKIYSTVTNKFYDTVKEAEAAEETAKKICDSKVNKIAELKKKIAEVKSKQVKEVTAAQNEIAEIDQKIIDLNARKNRISTDIGAINTEATLELAEFKKALAKLEAEDTCCCKKTTNATKADDDAECSIKVKTYNSDTNNGWTTLIDKTGTVEEVLKELVSKLDMDDLTAELGTLLGESDTSFKEALKKFGI